MADYHLGKVSIRPRGSYTSNTTYNFLDAVQDLGGTWLSLAASKDIEPGVTSGWQSYWMALAQGIQSVEITSPATGKATITVTYSNGTSTSTTIDTAAIPAGGVGTNELADGSVITLKIADGVVTRAKLAQDALYSPVKVFADTYALSAADIGKTLVCSASNESTVTLTAAASAAMPLGAEIALFYFWGTEFKIKGSGGVYFALPGKTALLNSTLRLPEIYTLVALKKITVGAANKDVWTVQGDVEVVT